MVGITDFVCSILPSNNGSLLSADTGNDLEAFAFLIIGVACAFLLLFLIYKLILKIGAKNVSGKSVVSDNATETENDVNYNSAKDEEIIAAITAAIAMAESEDSGLKFRVVAFKRI